MMSNEAPTANEGTDTTQAEETRQQSQTHGSLIAETKIENDSVQGCQFSPDGLCIATAQGQDVMLYNTLFNATPRDTWKPVLKCPGGDSVRSYVWYPHMNSSDPSTCCLLSASRDQPVHLYDAYNGGIRATYRPYNALDEMESPMTICFASNGQQIVTGGFITDRMLHVFDLNRPGRDPTIILKLGKTRRSTDGQKGLVSAMSTSESNLLAVGTYSPGSLYLYDLRAQSSPVSEIVIDGTCVVGHGKGHARKRKHFVDNNEDDTLNFSAAKVQWYQSRARTGVTQLEFSRDFTFLFSSSRRSNAVLQWDLRKLSSSSFCPGVASFSTCNDTNQRLEFAIDNNTLWIGGLDKCVRVYNLDSGVLEFQVDNFNDAVNGVSVASVGGKTYLATASASRKFPTELDWENDRPHDEATSIAWMCLHEMYASCKDSND